MSKYINTKEEEISFTFRPKNSEIEGSAEDLPIIVKLDGVITVRLTTSGITSAPEFNTPAEPDTKQEKEEAKEDDLEVST